MEQEHAVGEVVGDSPARKVEHVINGTREYTYVDGELVAAIDRDPKYQLDLSKVQPSVASRYASLLVETESGAAYFKLHHGEETIVQLRRA